MINCGSCMDIPCSCAPGEGYGSGSFGVTPELYYQLAAKRVVMPFIRDALLSIGAISPSEKVDDLTALCRVKLLIDQWVEGK